MRNSCLQQPLPAAALARALLLQAGVFGEVARPLSSTWEFTRHFPGCSALLWLLVNLRVSWFSDEGYLHCFPSALVDWCSCRGTASLSVALAIVPSGSAARWVSMDAGEQTTEQQRRQRWPGALGAPGVGWPSCPTGSE